jgi:hypothetical protein
MPRPRRARALAIAAVRVVGAAALAACRDGPFEIEPRALAGDWAGSAGTASVRLGCTERVQQGFGFDGQPTTSYNLECAGTLSDPARGIDGLRAEGNGSGQNARARQRDAGFSFGALVSHDPRASTSLAYVFSGTATDRRTVAGWLVLQRRQGTVFANGEVGGPETFTRGDSTRLTLRRQ